MAKPVEGLLFMVLFAAVCIALLLLAYSYFFNNTTATTSTVPVSFTVNNETFNFTSYALNMTEAERGLMNATITNRTFMLFAFHNSSIYQFWMKNTYTQLDIIWINADDGTGRIVYIANATPCIEYSTNQTNCEIYTPASVANYVIEAKAGFVKAYNVSDYEDVTFNYK